MDKAVRRKLKGFENNAEKGKNLYQVWTYQYFVRGSRKIINVEIQREITSFRENDFRVLEGVNEIDPKWVRLLGCAGLHGSEQMCNQSDQIFLGIAE